MGHYSKNCKTPPTGRRQEPRKIGTGAEAGVIEVVEEECLLGEAEERPTLRTSGTEDEKDNIPR